MEARANNYCVYIHTTPSGKVYIGITNQKPTRRWRNGDGYRPKDGETTPFFSAIKKYGWDNIAHEIVKDGLTKEEACLLEIELIKKYNNGERTSDPLERAVRLHLDMNKLYPFGEETTFISMTVLNWNLCVSSPIVSNH